MEKGNRRLLEILHSKDAIIDKLEKTLSAQARALSDQTNRFVLLRHVRQCYIDCPGFGFIESPISVPQ